MLQAVLLILVARQSPVSDFAGVAALSGAVLVGSAVADLGLSGLMLRARALGQNDVVRRALDLNAKSVGLGALVASGVAMLISPEELRLAWLLLTLAFFAERNADAMLSLPIADGDDRTPLVSIGGRRVAALALFFAAAPLTSEAILAYGLAYLGGAVFAQIVGRRYLRSVVWPSVGEDGEELSRRHVLKDSLHFMWPYVAGQARMLDVSVVAAVGGATSAGLYGAAVRLAQPALLVPSAVGTALLPHAARQASGYLRRAILKLSAAAVAGCLLLLPLAVWSEQLVGFIYGDAYRGGADAFAACLYGVLLLGITTPMQGVFQGQGHQRFVAIVSIVYAPVQLCLVALGAVAGGASGAAIGFLIGAAVRLTVFTARGVRTVS